MQSAALPGPSRAVPQGYTIHKESTTEILLPDGNQTGQKQVFINPIQEFNRDISVLAIQTWSELVAAEKQAVAERKRANKAASSQGSNGKKRKIAQSQEEEGNDSQEEAEVTALLLKKGASNAAGVAATSLPTSIGQQESNGVSRPYSFTLFEGLSATGLRSIRYAKELPLLKWVQANDLSPKAAENIGLNVQWNDLGPAETQVASDPLHPADVKGKGKQASLGKVRVSHGDCCDQLYAHRHEKERFDVIDLDPYGTAAPFIDGAVQAVADGGLLCVTCTDLAVLAGTNYPEKCFSNYDGAPAKAEYTHEVALRLLLHTLSSSAARYGRHIKPLLSLSIDYYIRVFVRVQTGPAQVKKVASQTGLAYICSQCQTSHVQRFGKSTEKQTSKGNPMINYGLASGPPTGPHCEFCGHTFQVAGPMWVGELYDGPFIDGMLQSLAGDLVRFGTASRIRGMLTLARHELQSPFYFTPQRVSSHFHATCPSLSTFASALLNGGYLVSRSHACAGSIKTTAPASFVMDVIREWVKTNPVTMANIKEGSPARVLLAKEMTHEIDLTYNKAVEEAMLLNIKLVRYQQNPTANWGPQVKAGGDGKNKKQKKGVDEPTA